MFIFTLVTSQNNAKFCAAYKWVKFFICCCWRPLPGNFYARRRFSSFTSSFASSSFLFIFVSQLSLALSSRSYSRKFAANLDFCIFISSGFGFNVVPRKLPKFNRVNDKVFSLLSLLCLPFLFFSTLHYKQQRENEEEVVLAQQEGQRQQALRAKITQPSSFKFGLSPKLAVWRAL